jgi:hypothetical protein
MATKLFKDKKFSGVKTPIIKEFVSQLALQISTQAILNNEPKRKLLAIKSEVEGDTLSWLFQWEVVHQNPTLMKIIAAINLRFTDRTKTSKAFNDFYAHNRGKISQRP